MGGRRYEEREDLAIVRQLQPRRLQLQRLAALLGRTPGAIDRRYVRLMELYGSPDEFFAQDRGAVPAACQGDPRHHQPAGAAPARPPHARGWTHFRGRMTAPVRGNARRRSATPQGSTPPRNTNGRWHGSRGGGIWWR